MTDDSKSVYGIKTGTYFALVFTKLVYGVTFVWRNKPDNTLGM